jgi:hypothetical protein
MRFTSCLGSHLQDHITNSTAHVDEHAFRGNVGALNEFLDQNGIDLTVHMV